MASRDKQADAENCKAKGNEALKAKDFDKAIEWYTHALELHENHVYYSNRSAAYLSKGFGDSALKDSLKCIEMKPDWPKGYSRKGAALHTLGKLDESIEAYKEGLKLDENNAGLKSGLEAAEQAKNAPGGMAGGAGGAGGLGSLFGPDFTDKIRAHPKLSAYMNDPSYVQMLNMMQSNPQMLQIALQDPRIQETFSEILGMRFETKPSESPEEIAARKKAQEEAEKKRKQEEEERERKRKEEEERIRRENETPEEREKRENKEKALEIKGKGNEHFKKKEFDQALELYKQARELDPDSIVYDLNIASAQTEKGDIEESIKTCEKAIEKGRSLNLGFKEIAKAYEKMGNATIKTKRDLESLTKALEYYNTAQLECSAPLVANKIKKIENLIKKEKEKAYLDPEKAAAAKEEGNVLFKDHKYPQALEKYSEAIKRIGKTDDVTAARYYGNRSATYLKLGDFGASMEDCKKALELDPTYVKMYARKGNIEFFLKQYHKCRKSYTKGLELDESNTECLEGLMKTKQAIHSSSGESDKQRAQLAMEDPEIQNIMSDPVMRQVLQDMADPTLAQKHMKNPEIAEKVETLIAAGIIQTR